MKLIPSNPSFLLLSIFLLYKKFFTSPFRIYLIEVTRGDIGYFSFRIFTNFSQEVPDGFKLEEAFSSSPITHNKQSKTMKWKHAREPGKHAGVSWPLHHIATTRQITPVCHVKVALMCSLHAGDDTMDKLLFSFYCFYDIVLLFYLGTHLSYQIMY